MEVCGGSGFGGIALGKILKEKDINSEILIMDLRDNSLQKAKNWSKRLGLNIETQVIDVRETYKIEGVFDIVLMFGLSAPHFNPWDMVKVISSVSQVLDTNGVFVMHESDRRQGIFLNNSYKWVLGREGGGKVMLNFHSGYDAIKGVVKRTYVSLTFVNEPITMEMYL